MSAVRCVDLCKTYRQGDEDFILMANDRFEAMIALAKEIQAADARGKVYAALVTSSAGFRHLQKTKRVHELIEIARDLESEDARYTFSNTAFGNTLVLGALIEQGHFQEILKMADGMSQASQRGQLIGRLFANAKVIGGNDPASQMNFVLDKIDYIAEKADSEKEDNRQTKF